MRTRTPRHRSWLAHLRRGILWFSVVIFCSVTTLVYSTSRGTLSSRSGRALTWSVGKVAAPLVARVPWWWWIGVGTVGIYLWVKHKFVMSVIFALAVGMYLATL